MSVLLISFVQILVLRLIRYHIFMNTVISEAVSLDGL